MREAATIGRAGRDTRLVALSLLHGAVLLLGPPFFVVAILLWWNVNTVAHNFIHVPFFRAREANRVYSAYLSLLTGVPHTAYQARHLRHHGLESVGVAIHEAILVGALWCGLLLCSPGFFWAAWLPGFTTGMGLCFLHSHYEHARGTRSNYSALYNGLFFNDGYHVEHHREPGLHWTRLPGAKPDPEASPWPAILRWLDVSLLERLEALALRSGRLQRFLVRTHERALLALVADLGGVETVRIVGGGMYPRSALILGRLLPDAKITILDASARHLDRARRYLDNEVCRIQGKFIPGERVSADLAVIPLSLRGDRRRVYEHPPARRVLVHDWIWSRPPRGRSKSVVVSWLLLKKLVLVS